MESFKFDLYDNIGGKYCFSVKKNGETIEEAEAFVNKKYRCDYSTVVAFSNSQVKEYLDLDKQN